MASTNIVDYQKGITQLEIASSNFNGLEIQKLLRSGKTPQDLRNEYGIKHNESTINKGVICFKYDQIKSKPHHRVVHEARGIILDGNNNWNIVAFPFLRFFNHNESHAAPIDWSTAKVYKKEDGSICVLSYRKDKWCFSTSGTADAKEMHSLIDEVWKEVGYSFPTDPTHTSKTFIFELLSPKWQIIVPQPTNRLILLGVRNNISFMEEDPQIYSDLYGWSLVESLPMTSLVEVIKEAHKLDPEFGEGFVVCDQFFNRIKVKSPLYVEQTHSSNKEKDARVGVLHAIIKNEGSEYTGTLPHKKLLYDKLLPLYYNIVYDMQTIWNNTNEISDKGTFCRTLNTLCKSKVQQWFKPGLIQMYTNKSKGTDLSVKEWISNQDKDITKLLSFIDP